MTKDAAAACPQGIAAGLLDRQGFAYVIAGCLLVGLHTFWVGRLKDVCAGLVAAAGVLVAYNGALAPVAIRLLNRYWPNFSYQHIPVEDVSSLVVKTGQAVKMLIENAALLAGGSFASGALFLAGVIAALARSARGSTFAAGTHARAITYCALGFAAQVFMFALMIARHRQVMAHGNWFGAVFPQSAALKRSIVTGRPDPIFDPAYKRFLDIHERWRRGDARPKTRS